ncbi:MAG: hypothetical protein ABI977_30175 [Acidobacteriota bacterium]
MANKAARKVILQIAILITLVVTANAIKPFSPGNVALHTLATARSFSFVLPEVAVERIEQANYLAQAYGKSLFDGDGSTPVWSSKNTFQSSQFGQFVAANFSAEPSAAAEIKDVESCGTGKKSSTAKRQVRQMKPGGRNNHDDAPASSAKAKEVARPEAQSVAMLQPVRLPALPADDELGLMRARIIPASFQLPLPISLLKLDACGKTEVKIAKLVATFRELPNLPNVQVSLWLVPQTVTVISRCSEEKPVKAEEVEEVESSSGTTVGPEEFFFGETFSDPMAQPLAPLTPECPRIL